MEARSVLGIKYLRKDQLLYELRIRKEMEEGSVPELARRLRGALGKPVYIDADVVGEVSTAVAACRASLSSLAEGIALFDGSSPSRSQVSRLRALADHIANRLKDIRVLDKELKYVSEFQGFMDEFLSLQQRLNGLQWCEGSDVDEAERGDGDRGGSSRSELSNVFGKLPNPLLPLIKDIRVLSIDKPNQILEVLWLTVRLEQQADALHMPHSVVCQVILPLTQGRLNRLVEELLRTGGLLQDLRKIICFEYLGARVRRDLIDEHCYREQRTDEGLGDYIEEIRLGMAALCVEVPESEAVISIVEGMRPQDRSRVLFTDKPQTFVDLDKMVTRIENIRHRDERRGGKEIDNEGKVSAQVRNDERRRCFRCGSDTHLARSCKDRERRRNT